MVWPRATGSTAALLLHCIRNVLAQGAAAIRERRALGFNERLRGVTRADLETGIDEEAAVAVSGDVQCQGWPHLAGRRMQAARTGLLPAHTATQAEPGRRCFGRGATSAGGRWLCVCTCILGLHNLPELAVC